jgi:hypothetical protein
VGQLLPLLGLDTNFVDVIKYDPVINNVICFDLKTVFDFIEILHLKIFFKVQHVLLNVFAK